MKKLGILAKKISLKTLCFMVVFLTALVLQLAFVGKDILAESEQLIKLSAENFTDENIYKYHDIGKIKGMNKMSILADEQDKLTNLAELPSKDEMSAEQWKPNFAEIMVGASGFVDLKSNYFVTKLIMFDINASPNLTISVGEPFRWVEQKTVKMDKYMDWQIVEIGVSTRYIQLKSDANESGISELYVIGYDDKTGGSGEYSQIKREKAVTTVDKALGVNAFVDDPLQVAKVGGHIREFHNVTFTNNGKNYFNPSANNAWNFDEYYKSVSDKGIDVVPCIQGTNTYMSGDDIIDFTGNERPALPSADATDPKSYSAHANVMFNYSARYGANKVSPDRLNLADNQKPLSGLNYIKYYENFNEPNKDWEGEESYFKPYEMAAMCSADYDGHEGVLGANYGVKNADSSAKLVMGGLVGNSVLEYIKLMKLWFECNRTDKLFAVDVINLHYYIKTANPDQTKFKGDLAEITDYVAKNLPGVEVWVTEYGAEIPASEIADTASPEYLEAKGFATVRMFLEGISAGVDRMTMFMLRDTESGIYSTDGLVTSKGSWQTKPAWHYLFGTKVALAGTLFDSVVKEDSQCVSYKFVGKDRDVYSAWIPSMTGETRKIRLKTHGKSVAQVTRLADFYAEGVTQMAKVDNGEVEVEISSRPVFVSLFDKPAKLAPTKKLVPIANIFGDTVTLKKIEVMFDQQSDVAITPSARNTGEITSYEQDEDYINSQPNSPENKLYPVAGTLDLGKEYYITDIGFFDANASGDIVVYALNALGTWQKIAGYGLNYYKVWRIVESERLISSRYIKIEKYSDAVCYEMALYGYPAD